MQEADLKKVTVDGLELRVGQMGAEELSSFSWRECQEGYEVIMHFRGERRFALCQHKNDADHIVESLNEIKALKKEIALLEEEAGEHNCAYTFD